MALCRVMLPNPYFRVGDFVETTAGEVQRVEVSQVEGRLYPGRFVGLVFPENLVRPYLLKVLSRGVDREGAHAELRNACKRKPTPRNEFWEELVEDGVVDE